MKQSLKRVLNGYHISGILPTIKHKTEEGRTTLPVVAGGAGSGGGALAAGLLAASSQAAPGDLPSSITGGAAVRGSFHSHLLSAVHLRLRVN